MTGNVFVNGKLVGPTNVPLSSTFSMQTTRVFDPTTRSWSIETVGPTVSVSASGYDDVVIPFDSFYRPVLQLQVQPTAIRLGSSTQVSVQANDLNTGAPVAGHVTIGGQVFNTNTTFPYTFTSTPATGGVSATGYPSTTVSFPVYTPQQRVWIDPTVVVWGRPMQMTVHAVDTTTGANIDGQVSVNASPVARTNVSFTYTFVRHITRTFDPSSRSWTVETTPTVLSVSATGYPVATLDLS